MDGRRREDGSPVGPQPWHRQGAVHDSRSPERGTRPRPHPHKADAGGYWLDRLFVVDGVAVEG